MFPSLRAAFARRFSLEMLAILSYLSEQAPDGARHADIAVACGNNPYTMDRYLRRLQKEGLVGGRKDPVDARVVIRFLTPQGVAVMENIADAR